MLWAGFALAGAWWAYPLLWLLPLLTWYHGHHPHPEHCRARGRSGLRRPFRNTRTTRAGWLERAFIAPYWVNYHLEHHLLFCLPCYRLPAFHAMLMAGPHLPRMEVQHGYPAATRPATARPGAEDLPGALVNHVRRVGDGARVAEDRAASGF